MGQYYTPVILNGTGGKSIGSFSPFDYENTMKLTEHSYLGNNFVAAVVAKAMAQSINNDRPITLAWLGDYATLDEDIRAKGYTGQHRDYERIFLRVQKTAKNRATRILPVDSEIRSFLKYADTAVFYDTIRREKLSLSAYKEVIIAKRKSGEMSSPYGEPEYLIFHPIPLLTAIGNGKGGGDYRGNHLEWIGKWALHPLLITINGSPDPEGEWKDISEIVLFEEKRG